MTEVTRFRAEWQRAVDEMFWGGEAFDDRQRRVDDERRERWFQAVRINPTVSDLEKLCRAATYGDLRGMLHDGDLYWWDSRYATHLDALIWMKVAGSKVASGVELHLDDIGGVGLCAFDDATFTAALKHPSLAGRFDADGVLI